MPGPTTTSKSWWGGSRGQQNTPVEVASEPARKGPPKPETEVAIADVRLEAAFDEKTLPGNRAGLLDLARQGYQKALQQDPKNKSALLGLARFYGRVGERDRATEAYQKYLTITPTDRDVVHEVALMHARWKDWSGAVTWCERALKIDPENITFRKTMAFCLARGGRWEEGFAVLCQIMPEAQARYNIARVLEHQNHTDATRQQLMLALKADPNYADAREFLTELDQGPRPNPATDPNAVQQTGYVQEP